MYPSFSFFHFLNSSSATLDVGSSLTLLLAQRIHPPIVQSTDARKTPMRATCVVSRVTHAGEPIDQMCDHHPEKPDPTQWGAYMYPADHSATDTPVSQALFTVVAMTNGFAPVQQIAPYAFTASRPPSIFQPAAAMTVAMSYASVPAKDNRQTRVRRGGDVPFYYVIFRNKISNLRIM